MTKLRALLGSVEMKRVFLFTDKRCNKRLDKFYTLQCGFSALERDSSVYIPYPIEEIWGDDTLYLAGLLCFLEFWGDDTLYLAGLVCSLE